jgi:hypothetical protein
MARKYDLPDDGPEILSKAISGILLVTMFLVMCGVLFGTVAAFAWMIDAVWALFA